MSSTGLYQPIVKTNADCLLGITAPSSVKIDDPHPLVLHVPPSFSHNPAVMSSTNICSDTNLLGPLTLGWAYVLSAYWSEVQNGSIYYMHLNAVDIPSHIADGHPFLQGLETQAEVDWWLAILASRNSWKATIQRHGQSWLSPWTLNHDCEYTSANESHNLAPTFKESLQMLRQFATQHNVLHQASMAFIAALAIPTHNLWNIPVRLPRVVFPRTSRMTQSSGADIMQFVKLVDLLPRFIMVSLFGLECIIRSAFYTDTVHSLSCGQWIQPAVDGWPESPMWAAAVGCQRCPSLSAWWTGMGISGLLSKGYIRTLIGAASWTTNLVNCFWTGARESYLCSVLYEDVTLDVQGSGPYRTVPKGDELLALYLASGLGPEGRLANPPICPWRIPVREE